MATTTRARILTLDIVRGVAVMGILAMKIYSFSLPLGAYFNPTVYGGASGIDLATWYADFLLFDGKMRGLFSLLFGASALLVIERAQARERSAAMTHYSRMVWLFAFGMDAWQLVRTRRIAGDEWTLQGATGMLSLDDSGEVQREPAFAVFRNGRPQRISEGSLISDGEPKG